MKTKTNLLAAGIFLAGVVNGLGQLATTALDAAQESVAGTPGVARKRAVVNFSELARREALARANPTLGGPACLPSGIANRKNTGSSGSRGPTSDGPPPGPPPVDLCPETGPPQPAASFFALRNEFDPQHWSEPPDTMGAVGPNHLMVMLNQGVRIQNRTGGVISTVSLANFWSPLGPFNTYMITNSATGLVITNEDVFDPRVHFNPADNRWIVCAVGDVGVPGDVGTNTSSLFVVVSQTIDPTGNWNLYRFDADANNLASIDYPFMGFNKDWIVVQGIMFSNSGFDRAHIYAFNKTNLYAGGTGTFTLFARSDIGFFQTPAATFDTNVSTLYLGQQLGEDNNTSLNSLRIFTITGPIGSEVFTIGKTVTATNRWAFNAPSGFNSNFYPQLGSTTKIYSKGANIQTLVYRNGFLWAVQTVYLPSGGTAKRSAVQWWQISPRGQIIQRGLIDDPSGVQFFAYPSLAVNRFNDVLIGYNRYSTNQYAGANYSFRAGSDPANTLRADTVLKGGEAPYFYDFGTGFNRWGDFSATMVDPVNELDLWTIQEYAATPSGGRDQWGTWWGHIVPTTNLAIQQSAWPNPVLEGQNLTYTLAVNYTGYTNVTGVTLTNLLAPSVTLLSVSSSRGNCTNVGGTISCDLGSFANGDSALITLVVSPTATNNITNTINVLANECGNPITSTIVTLVKADTDRDGISDEWEMANGLNQSDSSDAPLDSDGDGVINLKEYLAGTNPTNSASVFRITAVTRITTGTAPGERISFSTVAGRFYRIERSENLGSNGWVIVADEIPGTGGILAVTDPKAGSEAQRLYRVGVLP